MDKPASCGVYGELHKVVPSQIASELDPAKKMGMISEYAENIFENRNWKIHIRNIFVDAAGGYNGWVLGSKLTNYDEPKSYNVGVAFKPLQGGECHVELFLWYGPQTSKDFVGKSLSFPPEKLLDAIKASESVLTQISEELQGGFFASRRVKKRIKSGYYGSILEMII